MTEAAAPAPRTYARLDGDTVREVIVTTASPGAIYHSGLVWLDCTSTPGVAPSWTVKGTTFSPPVPVPPTVQQAMAGLAVRVAAIEAAGVAFNGKLVGVDSAAQTKLVSAFSMAGAGLWQDGTPWVCTDGSLMPLAKADVMTLAAKAAAYVAAITIHAASLVPLLATSPGTDISAGWPTNA